jgi:hypothetical protein
VLANGVNFDISVKSGAGNATGLRYTLADQIMYSLASALYAKLTADSPFGSFASSFEKSFRVSRRAKPSETLKKREPPHIWPRGNAVTSNLRVKSSQGKYQVETAYSNLVTIP